MLAAQTNSRPSGIVTERLCHPFRLARRSAGGLLLLFGSTACFLHRGPVRTNEMQIVATAAANDNSPTAVEAVMVYDATLLKTLLTMSAADWFAARDQLRNDFPEGFDSRAWEIVPGQQLDLRRLPFRKGAALLVFANFRSPGPHRARLDARSHARITLTDRDFTVTELK
jgi:type VI secretion system protein